MAKAELDNRFFFDLRDERDRWLQTCFGRGERGGGLGRRGRASVVDLVEQSEPADARDLIESLIEFNFGGILGPPTQMSNDAVLVVALDGQDEGEGVLAGVGAVESQKLGMLLGREIRQETRSSLLATRLIGGDTRYIAQRRMGTDQSHLILLARAIERYAEEAPQMHSAAQGHLAIRACGPQLPRALGHPGQMLEEGIEQTMKILGRVERIHFLQCEPAWQCGCHLRSAVIDRLKR